MSLGRGKLTGKLNLEDMEATRFALQQAQAVAQSATAGLKFGPREQVADTWSWLANIYCPSFGTSTGLLRKFP